MRKKPIALEINKVLSCCPEIQDVIKCLKLIEKHGKTIWVDGNY